MNFFYYFLCIFFSPLAVYLKTPNNKAFYLNIFLYLFCLLSVAFAFLLFIPPILHACYIVYKNKDTSRAIQKRQKFEQEEKEKNKLAE